MEASKEGEMPSEPASDTLPTEVKEERPKRTMLLAVIIAVIVVIAAIAAAIGLGLFGGKKEKENIVPTAGAIATTPTTIAIGQTVTFQSTANDTDGTIVDYAWYFGDGESQNGSALTTVTHTFSYGGDYWVYHVVKDDKGANASNEGAMVRVTVVLYNPPSVLADDHPWNEEWTNTTVTNNTAPFAFMTSDKDIISPNTAVAFNATSSYAIGGWHWLNATNATEGVGYNATSVKTTGFFGWITSAVVDFGDGSTAGTMVPGTWTASRTYAASGHYCASFNLTANNSGQSPFTVVKRTIHVLTPATTPGGIVKNPNAVIKATFGEPQTLDPAIDYESAGGEILINVYETLVWFKGSSAAELEPVLAKEIPTLTNGLVTPDGKNYTFNIKTGITFHDGTALNASDVVYSFQRVLRIHDPSSPYWMLSQVLDDYIGFVPDKTNATRKTVSWFLDHSDYNSTQSKVAEYLTPLGWSHEITEADCQAVAERVVTGNDTSVTFHLLKPYPGFLQILAYTIGDIVSQDYVQAHGGIVNGETNDWMAQHMCGTGPYKLVSWEVGSKIYLTRNDAYWGPKPALKDAYIIKANDVNTRILLLQAGDADIIDVALTYESLFTDPAKYRIVKGLPTFDLTFMTFNFNLDSATAISQFGGVAITDTFFHDIHMRKAFSHMLNFSLYQSNVALGNGEQPNGVIPNGMYGYNASIPRYNYSLQLAADELKNASSPYGTDSWYTHGFVLPMFYNAGNLGRQTASEMVQSSLRALSQLPGAGPMDATINPLDWPQFLAQMYNDYSYMGFYSIGWGPDYADPDDYTVPMLDPDYGTYPFYTGYRNDSIATLLRSAAVELNDTVRKDMYSNMSQQVYEDVPYIWLNQPKSFHLERSWLSGYQFNPMYSTNILFKTLSKPTA